MNNMPPPFSIPRFFEARTQYLCSKMVEETCTTNCTVEWVPCQDCQDNCTDGQEWKAQLELTELRKNPYYVQVDIVRI